MGLWQFFQVRKQGVSEEALSKGIEVGTAQTGERVWTAREGGKLLPARQAAGSTITPQDPLPSTVPCYNALCEQLGENTWWWKIFTLFFILFEEAREDT